MDLITERKKLTHDFSRRLIDSMRENGHESTRSKAGIDITKLARITGCSYQMARKYSLGQAMPELPIILKIAAWLNSSPSWLLFGNKDPVIVTSHKTSTSIEIEPELLKYILTKSSILFAYTNDISAMVSFIVDSIYDASHLNADINTIHKIIDMMVSSVTLTNNSKVGSNQA